MKTATKLAIVPAMVAFFSAGVLFGQTPPNPASSGSVVVTASAPTPNPCWVGQLVTSNLAATGTPPSDTCNGNNYQGMPPPNWGFATTLKFRARSTDAWAADSASISINQAQYQAGSPPHSYGAPNATLTASFPKAGYWDITVYATASWDGGGAGPGCINNQMTTGSTDIYVTAVSVSYSPSSVTVLVPGGTAPLNAYVVPADSASQVQFATANPTIATVSTTGSPNPDGSVALTVMGMQEGNTYVYGSVGGTPGGPQVPVLAVQPKIERSMNGVGPYLPIAAANGNTEALPGNRIDLRVNPPGPPGTGYQWALAPTTFAEYVATVSSAVLTKDPPVKSKTTIFYWVDSGAKNVACQLTMPNGAKMPPITATITVQKVTYDMSLIQGKAMMAPDGSKIGAFGDPNNANIQVGYQAGMEIYGTVNVPAGWPNQGYWCYVQLITGSRYAVINGKNYHWQRNGNSPPPPPPAPPVGKMKYDSDVFPYRYGGGKDVGVPYDTGIAKPKPPFNKPPQFVDTPNISLPAGGTDVGGNNWTRASIENESFKVYIMFLPREPNSRWVPLAVCSWSYSVAADFVNGAWTQDAATGPVATLTDTMTHPEWDENIGSQPDEMAPGR